MASSFAPLDGDRRLYGGAGEQQYEDGGRHGLVRVRSKIEQWRENAGGAQAGPRDRFPLSARGQPAVQHKIGDNPREERQQPCGEQQVDEREREGRHQERNEERQQRGQQIEILPLTGGIRPEPGSPISRPNNQHRNAAAHINPDVHQHEHRHEHEPLDVDGALEVFVVHSDERRRRGFC